MKAPQLLLPDHHSGEELTLKPCVQRSCTEAKRGLEKAEKEDAVNLRDSDGNQRKADGIQASQLILVIVVDEKIPAIVKVNL